MRRSRFPPIQNRARSPTRGLAAGVFVLTVAIAWSRLALGRHTVAEVLGGALLGAAVGGGSSLL